MRPEIVSANHRFDAAAHKHSLFQNIAASGRTLNGNPCCRFRLLLFNDFYPKLGERFFQHIKLVFDADFHFKINLPALYKTAQYSAGCPLNSGNLPAVQSVWASSSSSQDSLRCRSDTYSALPWPSLLFLPIPAPVR